MSRALVIGASGLVGSYLCAALVKRCEVTGTFCAYPQSGLWRLDITDAAQARKVVSEIKPDFVFLPGAFTNVELAEEKPDICRAINVEGTRNLVSILRENGGKLVYFSTDYIFDGKSGPWDEAAVPAPLSAYGASKLDAEELIRNGLKDYLIIRTTWVYGCEPRGKNFVLGLIRRLKNKEELKVPDDQFATPTYAADLAEVSCRLAEEGKTGIYNVAGASLVSRLEFALLAAEVFGLEKSLVRGVKTETLGQKAKRPLNAGLRIEKLKKELQITMPTVKESLLRMRKEIGNGDQG